MRRGESLQGSGDPERGLSVSLSTFPGSYKVATTKKEGQDGGKGWDRAAMAGARFGVTTVYLVLRLPGGGSCAGMGVLQAAISKQTRGRGGMRLCFWARSSLAPVCVTASLQGLRRSSQQVGRGTRNQSFRVRLGGGVEREAGAGGRRRQQMTTTLRQLANSSDPGATATASVPTRSARRLASSAPERCLRGTGTKCREHRRKAARRREMESHRWLGQGRRDAVARVCPQDRSLSLRGAGVRSESVWWWGVQGTGA